MTKGFLQLRRGLIEHLDQGRIGLTEFALCVLIYCLADPETGIWWGSSGLLALLSSIQPRTARDDIEKLETKGYLKRFPTPGSHSKYPILVHKYECSDGAMKGRRLNSTETSDWRNPVYELCEDGVKDGAALKEENKNKNTAGARVPLAYDSEFLKITEKQDRALADAFPFADLPAEYRKMASWLAANPAKRKSNHNRFAHNWLARIPQPPAPRKARPGWDDELDVPILEPPFRM